MRRSEKHYWLKLHFLDWHNSAGIIRSSMQARGVAIEAEMLIKRYSPEPGRLLMDDGKPMSLELFAKLSNGNLDEVENGMKELLQHHEFVLDGETLVCPRLLAQAEQSQKMKQTARGRWGDGDATSNGQRTPKRKAGRNAVRNAARKAERTAPLNSEL